MHILHEIGLDDDFIDVLKSIPNEIRHIEAIDNDAFKTIKRYNNYHKNKNKMNGEENANVGNSLHPSNRYGKVYEPSEKIKSYNFLYIKLRETFPKQRCDEILKEVIEGSLAINDSENIDLPYCIAFSSTFMMKQGRTYIKDVPNISPTTSISYMNMATEAIFDASSEFMGATVIFDLIIGLSFYTNSERETKHLAYKGVPFNKAVSQLASEFSTIDRTYAEAITELLNNSKSTEEAVNYIIDYKIKNLLQSWVHIMGNKFRKNHQSVFTNLNLFSPRILKENFDYYVFPNGDKIDKYIDEITTIQLIFAKFFSQGIKGKRITKVVAMPVVTLMLPNDEVGGEELQEKDDYFVDSVLKYFHKYNNINVYRGLRLAICCRITVSKPTHKVDVNSLGVVTGSNGNDAVGSLRVVTTALPNVVYELMDDDFYNLPLPERFEKFKTKLKYKLEIADDILETQRKIIYERNEEGLYQLGKAGWVNFKKLASTYGGVGVYEALKLITGNTYGTKYTQEELDLGNEILKIFDEQCINSTNKYKNPYNMEVSIPAESMAIRFRNRDVIKYGEENIPYKELSNQFTPLTLEVDMVEKLQNEDYLSSRVDPTGICHINIDGKISPEQNVSLHRNLWKNYPNIDHYAFNAPISTCLKGHSEPTNNDGKCIVCGEDIEFTTSRSIGYFKSVEFDFGKGRRDEFNRRKFTKI